MVYLRSVAVCTTLDCFHNEDARQELNAALITANTDSYRKRWGEHSLRMDGSRFWRSSSNIIRKMEELSDAQERDALCEVRRGQRPNP